MMEPYFVPILTRETRIQVGYAGEFRVLGPAVAAARRFNADPANRNFICPVWEIGPSGDMLSVPFEPKGGS